MAENNIPKISKANLAFAFSLSALGLGEYFALPFTMWLGFVLTILTGIISLVILVKYACDYIAKNEK